MTKVGESVRWHVLSFLRRELDAAARQGLSFVLTKTRAGRRFEDGNNFGWRVEGAVERLPDASAMILRELLVCGNVAFCRSVSGSEKAVRKKRLRGRRRGFVEKNT